MMENYVVKRLELVNWIVLIVAIIAKIAFQGWIDGRISTCVIFVCLCVSVLFKFFIKRK